MTFSSGETAVDALVAALLERVGTVFGPRLLAFYLDGSLTSASFDQASDIDFVAVLASPVEPAEFAALEAVHADLARLDPRWGVEIEGSYIPAAALRRYDPAQDTHPNMERGPQERLKWVAHGPPWDVHRSILRERGIALLGPPPTELIEPVPPERLRAVMRDLLEGWGAGLAAHPERMDSRGYQSYVVLSLCRAMYTLSSGRIASKPAALAWARQTLAPRWHGLLERAWIGRSQPNQPADSQDLQQTLELIRLARQS